jgi:hypothetical protein
MALVTVQDIKDELEGICEIDSNLISDAWITNKRDKFVVPWVEGKTGFSVTTEQTITEYYDGNGENYLILNVKPVNELVALEYVASADYSSSMDITEFILLSEEGMIKANRTEYVLNNVSPVFLRGNKNIKVTYKAGYNTDDIPDQLNEVIKYLVCEKILGQLANRTGGGNITTPGYSRNYGGMGKYTDLRREYARQAMVLLDDYITGVIS